MENDADASKRRKAESASKSKRVEEGKNAKDAVAAVEVEDLLNLFDIRHQIEMRKNYAFRFAGGPAAENNGRRVIERSGFADAEKPLEHSRRKQFCGQEGRKFFASCGIQG